MKRHESRMEKLRGEPMTLSIDRNQSIGRATLRI